MVLILPVSQPDRYCPPASTTAGLLASIRNALSAGCDEDMSRINVRILGSYVIIEGLVSSEDCVDTIREIAEDIAGKDYVSLRLFRQ